MIDQQPIVTPDQIIDTPLVQQQRARIATEIGMESRQIGTKNADWYALLKDGVIVETHIKRYRAKDSIGLEDLGIIPADKAERDAYERVFSLGTRNLLPAEVMDEADRIDGQARKWLEKNSFRTFWGRFIHVKQYPTWAQKNLEYRDAYLGLGRSIGERYETLLQMMGQDLRTIAPQILTRLEQAGYALPDDTTRTVWMERFITRAIDKVPPAEDIVRSFSYTWDVSILPVQADIMADKVRADELQMVAQERARLAAEDAMRADLARSEAERSQQGVSRFVADVKQQIHDLIYDAALDGLEAIRNQDRIPRGTSMKIQNMIETVSSMMFWQDPELEQRLADLQAQFEVKSTRRDKGELTSILTEVAAEARINLLAINRPPQRSAKSVDIPDAGSDLERLAIRRVSRTGRALPPPTLTLDPSELLGRRTARTTPALVSV